MVRLRFVLRINRIKAAWIAPGTLAMTRLESGYAKETAKSPLWVVIQDLSS
jgi:hypothetical protein